MITKIGVLSRYTFPEGMAPTTRIIAYSKGLKENGVSPELFSFKSKLDSDGDPLSGMVCGIPYKYSHFWHTRKNKLYKFLFDRPKIMGNAVKDIIASNKEKPFDFILLSFDEIELMKYYVPRLKKAGLHLLTILDEYPEPIRKLKSEVPIWMLDEYKKVYEHIDGRILMTEALKAFYDEKVSPKPTYILSNILDEDRFAYLKKSDDTPLVLTYMGNMALAKDNVDNIIRAFNIIKDDFPSLELHLYGAPSDHDRAIIEELITGLNLEKRVIIKGRIGNKEVPQTLVNSTILVTSQPNTKRAEGGFPTKMGEYMMSHTPMLVTDVGEIHNYVQDGVTTFMVPPENPEAYADKLRFILTHPDVSKKVSDNAYEYAVNHFGCKQVTAPLVTFLDKLKKEL